MKFEEIVKELSLEERVALKKYWNLFEEVYKIGVKDGFNWNNELHTNCIQKSLK